MSVCYAWLYTKSTRAESHAYTFGPSADSSSRSWKDRFVDHVVFAATAGHGGGVLVGAGSRTMASWAYDILAHHRGNPTGGFRERKNIRGLLAIDRCASSAVAASYYTTVHHALLLQYTMYYYTTVHHAPCTMHHAAPPPLAGTAASAQRAHARITHTCSGCYSLQCASAFTCGLDSVLVILWYFPKGSTRSSFTSSLLATTLPITFLHVLAGIPRHIGIMT